LPITADLGDLAGPARRRPARDCVSHGPPPAPCRARYRRRRRDLIDTDSVEHPQQTIDCSATVQQRPPASPSQAERPTSDWTKLSAAAPAAAILHQQTYEIASRPTASSLSVCPSVSLSGWLPVSPRYSTYCWHTSDA